MQAGQCPETMYRNVNTLRIVALIDKFTGNSLPFCNYKNIHYRKEYTVDASLNFLILSSFSRPIYLRHFKQERFLISHLAALRKRHVKINMELK